MKELKYGAFILCLTLCCLFVGYYLGYCEANGISLSEALSEGVQETETEIAYNKTIAIINMDEGVEKNDNTMNYALALIDTITDDVTVTGLEDARRGIESGTYSAYIMIPGTFSENVSTVTTKPVKSQLTYALGTGLTGEERDEVLYRIEAILQLFSNNLSKVYLSSILEEYHDAQDSASSIMANDTADMELLLAVEGEDLIELIEIPEVTIVENEIEALDLSENYAQNQENAENIDSAYREYYEEGKQALTEIQDSFETTEEQIASIKTELEAANSTAKAAAENTWDGTAQAAAEDVVYQEIKDLLIGALNAEAKEMEEGEEQSAEEMTSETEQPAAEVKDVEELFDQLITTAKANSAKRDKVIEEKEAILAELYTQTQALVTAYEEMKTSYEENHSVLSAFDMSTYIDDAEISSYVLAIEENLYDVEEKVSEQVAAYEEYVYDVYEATQNDIESFEESIIEGQERSELKLTEGLAKAKESRALSNETNLKLLNTLTERLPYTRLGEVENKEVYDFIAEPIIANNRSEPQKEIQETKSPGIGLAIAIAVLVTLLLVASAVYLTGQRRKRSEELQEVPAGESTAGNQDEARVKHA